LHIFHQRGERDLLITSLFDNRTVATIALVLVAMVLGLQYATTHLLGRGADPSKLAHALCH